MSKTPNQGSSIYPDMLHKFEAYSRKMSSAQPEVTKAFWELHKATVNAGVLETKTKELMALAISVVSRCEGCIAHHVCDALKAGASTEEIEETLNVAVLMGGGVSVVYATHAMEAVEQFLEQDADQCSA